MTAILAKYGIDEKASVQAKSLSSVWFFLAPTLIAAILVAAVCWSFAHPYGVHWDESQYLNDLQIDGQRFRTGHLFKLAGRILIKDFGRPPAYRLLGFPFIGVFGYHTTGARLISLACYVLSAFVVFLTVRRMTTPAAGAFAVLVFALSPEIVSASIFFGTDTLLYLATAAMLYFVFASWSDREQRTSTWVGLGCAVGLGLLAKTSFLLIALPVFGFWFAAGHLGRLQIPPLSSQRKAGLLALLIAAPWWALNLSGAIAYVRYARGDVGNSLGPPSLGTWTRWLNTVLQCLLGSELAILIALVLIALLIKLVKKRLILSNLQTAAVGACACAGLPIIVAQLSGTNHLLRHITPSVVPLAVAIGVFACASGWVLSRAATVVSVILLTAQAAVLIAPVVRPNRVALDLGFANGALPSRTMIRFDQWDWRPARNLADSCGVKSPKISVLGGGRAFNPPQIQFPWVVRATSTTDATLSIPNVTWLWRFNDGLPDWQKIMDAVDQSDMIITAPQYKGDIKGKEDPDDQYNAEFKKRLLLDPRFQAPFLFEMGRFAPVEIAIFVKKSLSCSSSGDP
jgi:4-amino-4-deoxy-L-arabinose transferase-like glycosyltransferase